MALSRLISPPLRSGLLLAAGSALIALPLALSLSAATLVTGMATGTITMALGLSGTDGQGRGTLSLGVQAVYDRGLALGLLGSALAFGLGGNRPALALFGAVGVGVLAVALTTRYTVRPASS